MKFQLYTNLPINTCVQRLTDATDRLSFNPFAAFRADVKPVIASINAPQIQLHKRRYYRNSFAPYVFGTLADRGNGTQIEGRIGMHPAVLLFMGIWLGILLLVTGTMVTGFFLQSAKGTTAVDWSILLVPVFMLFVGGIAVGIGIALGKSEERFLISFLKQTLEAEEMPQTSWS